MIWNYKTLSTALGLTIPQSIICNEVQFNSKDVKKGDLFIALQGNSDGHNYVQDAINQGAVAVIVSKQIDISDKNKIILVDDCFKALERIAEYKRSHSKAKFIAITGSVGKTSTKEALRILLTGSPVFASRGNFNNRLGLLINLASMPDDIEFAIFELGMNHKGEIRELAQILKPNIAMITNISEAHLEFFNSLEEIAEAKCEIFESFSKSDIAIINADTNCYDKILSILKNLSINNIYSFGRSSNSSAELTLYENLGDKVHLKYNINNRIIDVTIPFIPKHFAKNYAGVLLVISILNQDLVLATEYTADTSKVGSQISGEPAERRKLREQRRIPKFDVPNLEVSKVYLADITLTKGRGEIINIANSRIICDYYNASPESMKAALKYLGQLPAENKTAIIGEMLELGQNSERLHKELVPYILDAGCSKVFLVGANTKYIHDLLPSKIVKKYFNNVDELIAHITDLFENNELILIKGSRGVKLDKIIDYYNKLD